jgi:peptidoglycan/LPS O-acetylase OafA/YrhL
VTFWLPVLASWKSKSARNGLIEKSVVKISLWSYSLYLVHVPLMEGFRIFILSDSIDNSFFQILVFFIWIFCALILSFFIYRFFEKPFTDLRDRKSNGEWLRAFISDFSLIRSKK